MALFATPAFVTGDFKSHASFLPDDVYATVLDNIVKATNDMILTHKGKIYLGCRNGKRLFLILDFYSHFTVFRPQCTLKSRGGRKKSALLPCVVARAFYSPVFSRVLPDAGLAAAERCFLERRRFVSVARFSFLFFYFYFCHLIDGGELSAAPS